MKQEGYFAYDLSNLQAEKLKLDNFLAYRKKFEMSQQVRIQSKIEKKFNEAKTN